MKKPEPVEEIDDDDEDDDGWDDDDDDDTDADEITEDEADDILKCYTFPYPRFEDEVDAFCVGGPGPMGVPGPIGPTGCPAGAATQELDLMKWKCPGCGALVSLSMWGMEVHQHVKDCAKVAECPARDTAGHGHKCVLCHGTGFVEALP